MVVDEITISVTSDSEELIEFVHIVRDLLQTADKVAASLERQGIRKEASQLYKAVFKMETYLNPHGDKESEAH